jgi:[ribosomal protein S5]-alanine N-acetyltransferase
MEPNRVRPVLTVDLLTPTDAQEVLSFEQSNRVYFAREVGDRGDEYFADFASRHESLVAENREGVSLLFVVRDRDGYVVGRVNVGPIEGGEAPLGYRIAESATGRGYASEAVRQAVQKARDRSLTRLHATAALHNVASCRVLERNGFRREPRETTLEYGGREHAAARYTLELGS